MAEAIGENFSGVKTLARCQLMPHQHNGRYVPQDTVPV
jgi:hypothetical protein